MNIVFLNIYGGVVSRGAETMIAQLAKRLGTNHDVTVIQAGNSSDSSYKTITISGIPTYSTDVSTNLLFRVLKKVYLDPYSLIVLYFALRTLPFLLRNTADIVIPINGFWQIIICKLIGVFKKNKLVLLGLSGIGIDDYINLKLAPDGFFSMSHVGADWAKKVNPNTHIGVVPGGVDRSVFSPIVAPRAVSLRHPIVVVVAALVPYKHVDLAIKAIGKLPTVSLLVVGDGPMRHTIDALGHETLGARYLRLTATLEELPAIYTACDVFTLPSIHEDNSLFSKVTGTAANEAFGIVYVEAMASGLPVVAPDDSLRREIVGKGGLYVDPRDTDAYAQTIEKALASKETINPVDQAKHFDWDTIAKQFSNELVALTNKQ